MSMITQAITEISSFENGAKLAECFCQVARKKPGQDMMEKMSLGVMLASDDNAEVNTFAKYYTQILRELGFIQKNQLVEVTWPDLAGMPLKNSDIPTQDESDAAFLNVKQAFIQAAGGILLIRDAYKGEETLADKMANYTISGTLCEFIDKADFKNGNFIEKSDKPVVILTGASKEFVPAYQRESQPFNMRFMLNRFGF